MAVLDFGKSWRSGLVFLAVIKSIDPSLVDMRKALLRSARENLEEAFRIAHYGLGIPRLLEPEGSKKTLSEASFWFNYGNIYFKLDASLSPRCFGQRTR